MSNTNEAAPKSPGTLARIANDFASHDVNDETRRRMAVVRNELASVARKMVDLMPGGREQALVITKLEEAMFWANAGLARPHLKAGS